MTAPVKNDAEAGSQPFDVSRFFFYVVCCLAIVLGAWGLGLYTGIAKVWPYGAIKTIYADLSSLWNERENLTGARPVHHLFPARYEGNGVTVNEVPQQDDFVFLMGFFDGSNELRLIRRDGSVVARWPVSFSEIFPDPSHRVPIPDTDWNIGIHGGLSLPDGSVVFSFDYGGLVKLDRCGEVVWKLPRMSHHSVQPAADGGFWVPGRERFERPGESPFPPFEAPFWGDTIMKVSDDGVVLSEMSVLDLLLENNLASLLTLTGANQISPMRGPDNELSHLNKIVELTAEQASAYPMFDAGDLMISLRDRNLILVFDPDSREVLWWKIGPWVRQHDPDFDSRGRITIFDNYRDEMDGRLLGGSRIVEADLDSGVDRVLYGDRPEEFMYTQIRGQHTVMPGGGLFIVESNGGRVFQTDMNRQTVWEYVNRYDADDVAHITEAHVYSPDFFKPNAWACE